MSVSEALEPALFREGRPRIQKLGITLQIRSDREVEVTLLVPLDRTRDAERRALEAFEPDSDSLPVQYRVEIDLRAERGALAHEFERMYRDDDDRAIGKALRAPVLGRLDDIALRRAMMPIAELGNSVYRRMFQPEELNQYNAEQTPIVLEALASALGRSLHVSVTSPISLFPWALLHDGPVDRNNRSTLDMKRFWGFARAVQEELPEVAQRPMLGLAQEVVAAVASDVDTAGRHAAGALGKVQTRWISRVSDLRSALKDFQGNCFYFYGHASQEDPPRPTSSMLALQDEWLSVDDLAIDRSPQMSRNPVFVFLNGCGTTPLNTWNRDSFPGRLCFASDKRVCCLTTFAEVPIAFGLEFGERFWTSFLAPERLGASLLAARRAMFEEFNNPMGLLYTVLGKIETRFDGAKEP